ncbi:RhoGEF [Nesidiocoris tenuis]|uniref:RhoGEF n=1 Tax=Nesidiocoris tenuis TaxID=355587 RepID=A0ABN7B2Q0_9HEMI|nr:RhoGEF [Nesidiocoris tenuis]
MASSGGGGGTKGKSARRKISLPWFRQASTAGPALSRQHTIDTPSSFHKRLLSRQTTGQVLSAALLPLPGGFRNFPIAPPLLVRF